MKAARGFALGLQLLLAASAAALTAAQTADDSIPEVGIGAVHPICDPLQEECISSDEQVQDDIIAGLQADDKVTGAYVHETCAHHGGVLLSFYFLTRFSSQRARSAPGASHNS